MMFSGLPVRLRRQVQAVLSAAWLLAAAAGVSMWLPPPNPLEEVLGEVAAFVSGTVLTVSAAVAGAGVMFRAYRWEWVASWVAGAAIVPYSATAWTLMLTLDGSFSTSALLSTSLLAFFASRALLCAAHAAKLRAVHTVTATVIEAIGEGDDGDDTSGAGG